ncbi:hypothetical protein RJT34_14206 [Clitoria ternatea]|uniref:Arogenate dehydratase n=1 Tax=Clitoria ternatea TaxID=43366 RepID=A0AAN9PMJ6_CLITE
MGSDGYFCSKAPQLGFATFQHVVNSRLSVNLRYDLEKCSQWERCCLSVLPIRALAPIGDEKKPIVTEVESSGEGDKVMVQLNELKEFHKDINLPPKPLTANDYPSLSDGSKMRVAYQGLTGAYSEDAALKAYPNCETVPCDEFETTFKAVELRLADKAVLPIECSIGGSIHHNYDLLLRHRLHIIGEVQLKVNHCLLALSGVRKEELKGVMSHPQALIQCEMMLNDLGVVKVGTHDTAAAAKIVASNGKRDTAAIASSRAGKIYGLDILSEEFQDEDDNITRFLILAREPIIPGTDRPYKTSIVFSLQEGPGVLFKALGVFALRNINLSKIESRPLKEHPLMVVHDSNEEMVTYFDYLFYIDFEASMADPNAQYALENLQEYARFIRVLGCYPVERI